MPVRNLAAYPWPSPLDALLPALSAALEGRGPAIVVVPADGADRVLSTARTDIPLERPDVAAVVPTSGSTGTPKGVLLTAEALSASAGLTHDRLGGTGQWLLALPPTHIAGLQVLVRSLLAGQRPVELDLTDGFDGARFVAAAERLTGPRTYTALVPTQLARMIDGGGAALDALRSFDAVLVGGAPAAEPVLNRARNAGVRIVTTYGMTETAGGCIYDGTPLDGVSVRVDPDAVIRISGPTLAAGYRLDPAQTAMAFRDGWFVTADRGRFDPSDRLVVLGRVDDAILSGGVTIDPVEVESALAGHPKVADVAVFGLPSQAWGQEVTAAVVPTDPADPPMLSELHAFARAALGAARAPRKVLIVAALPRSAGGKLDRRALGELTARPST